MSRYNLIDEKWIPVRYLDGSRDELGIRDALLRSTEIATIEDSSPLVVAAVYRFLLAVLYRALAGPTDIVQAKALFKDGLPAEAITSYLEKWRDRFWLFDDRYPFGQIPTFEPKTWRAWTALAAEHNADNAKVLFDHIDINAPGAISEAAACRWMLATQTFAVSSGKSELSHTGTAPSATAAIVIPIGGNLQDTLLLCLVPQNREICALDLPLWEREPEVVETLIEGEERSINGYADRYTWRSRAVRWSAGHLFGVDTLAFASGIGNASKDQSDPMVAYRIDEKKGKLPIQFPERGLWRNFDSLLPDQSKLAPAVVEHATTLSRLSPDRFPKTVMVLGQANDKAKIEYWRAERYTLPESLRSDRMIRAEIRQILAQAEEYQKGLWLACSTFARDLLSRGERKVAAKDVSQFVRQMSAISSYWTSLEAGFHNILREYSLDLDAQSIHYRWLRFIRDAVNLAWDGHRTSVAMGDAWVIRAMVRAEVHVLRTLKRLNMDIESLEPGQKEVA